MIKLTQTLLGFPRSPSIGRNGLKIEISTSCKRTEGSFNIVHTYKQNMIVTSHTCISHVYKYAVNMYSRNWFRFMPYFFEAHLDVVEVLGILMEDGEDGLLTDSHLHFLQDHPDQPFLLAGGRVLDHVTHRAASTLLVLGSVTRRHFVQVVIDIFQR